MFVRRKPNITGSISVQIIDKSSGKYRVVKTLGSARGEDTIKKLEQQARQIIAKLGGQTILDFIIGDEQHFLQLVEQSIEQIQLLGPELVLGKLFDEIGFGAIKDELFRHLVITRLVYPVSKLKTTDYLFRYKAESYGVDQLYRYLDKLHDKQQQLVQQISFEHTKKILGNDLAVVFYDVTTLYFEAEAEDDLRKTGFSKDGKAQHPQILLGLLVSVSGYPLAYEIFEGNKFEGHTMLPVIDAFRKKYSLNKLVVIADAGLLSNDNINELQQKNYEFILGARIKNETEKIKKQIIELQLGDGQSAAIEKSPGLRLIVSYAQARAHKDAQNRKRGLGKLEAALAKGRLNKQHINNRGYNKYLKLQGQINITIDYEKYNTDAQWDGLKGYLTNTSLSNQTIIENYKHLWQIEKAFRISKTDLRIRPIYHHIKRRIQSHICIAFCAYKVYKELERQLNIRQIGLTAEKAIDILKSIFGLQLKLPQSHQRRIILIAKQQDQQTLLKSFEIDFGCPIA